ncbi:amidase family protein [Leisingera sp. M658]|uniref:amidase family protein n=1 Tax=Leisingera sp. M658 TaxID=2867015 RepID=UPI0021A580D5|nr:amidase family protein [Leisingera sp. M658]UWQ75829.1 hypothetical protein K3724_05070 [Leisingera sp. M658]
MTKPKTGDHPDLKMVNPNAAAIDIGSTMHMAAVNPNTGTMPVRAFGTFTQDLHDLASWFQSCGVTSVAMESTGVYLPAFKTLEMFRVNTLSPVEHMQAVIDRAAEVEPKVNAFTYTYFDEAMSAARAAEEKSTSGQDTRPLEGLAIGIKDESDVEGLPASNGSLLLKDIIATSTSPMNEHVFRAGGIMHARTATPEFSGTVITNSKLWGVTRNPWNLSQTPGGSSGGSSASLASGSSALCTGSDVRLIGDGDIQQVSNDNGTEYGRDPFGGAAFSQAVRHLAVSHMNTVAGVSSLRGHMERFFWTCDLKWARYLPGYTANNPQNRNDRKPGEEACITDDELHAMFVAFIAEYHNTPHRGLNFRTPAAVWDELTEGQTYDYGQMPSASQLREACGFYTDASVCEAGIRYAGAVYSNEYTRNQRKARLVDRIAKPGEKVEIKVDPFDLGAITVLAKGEMISVSARDPQMNGKTLRQWQTEKLIRKQRAEAENLSRKGARDEACNLWEKMASSIAQNADVGMSGYSQAEIDRAALELGFGKGQHEKPYIGRDEYVDPVHGGFEIGGGEFVEEDHLREEAETDSPTSMDRFRSAARNRKRKKKPELE